MLVTVGIPLLVTSQVLDTTNTTFYIYDATLSEEYQADSTIPYWMAGLVPYIQCVLSYLVGEIVFWSAYHASLTSAIASCIHFCLDTIVAGLMCGLLTEVTKQVVGRHRPDWLQRCNPAIPEDVTIGPFGLPASSNPVCNSTLTETKIEDGKKSFPSGHSSTAFVLAVYGIVYCIWAACYRPSRTTFRTTQHNTVKQQLASDAMSFIVLIWVLWQISFAWGIGVSRLTDNKHHYSDVVGGAFLGTLVAAIFSMRAIPRHYRVADTPTTHERLLDASPGAQS